MKKILLLVVALAGALPAAVLAQETRVRETIPAAPFLAGAYAFMWVAVLVYVALVARRLSRVHSDIEDLRRKMDHDRR